MGKLNYSARRISGVKAAQVVSKDLRKRIPPGINAKAAARDPTLEIDVAGKDLTDEGFAQFIDDLLECIKYRDSEHTEGLAKVTEFHIQGNKLSAQSLPKLGEVIALSNGDLRELDISNNNISINTPEEKEIWFNFLDSFKDCYMLKKLDLGSNPLGRVGLEILARVYIKSDLDFLEGDAEAIIGTGPKGDEEQAPVENIANKPSAGKENEPPRPVLPKKSPNKGKAAKHSSRAHAAPAVAKGFAQAELKHFACTRGLRSIPSLIISDISLTNGCAVHISSMLEIQKTPDQLLSFLPAGKALTLPEAAQSCKGIIWQPNDLAPHAKKLLEVAGLLHDIKTAADSEDEGMNDDEDADDSQGSMEPTKLDTAAQRKMQNKRVVEFTRLTKRVRLEALKLEGIHSMDIWIAALKMMLYSRAFLLEDKDRAGDTPLEEELSLLTLEDPVEEQHVVEEEVEAIAEPEPEPELAPPVPTNIEFFPPFLAGPFHPRNEAFEANFPALQAISTEKDQATTHDEEEEAVNNGTSTSLPHSQPPRSGKGHSRVSGGTRAFRKTEWKFGLPLEFWRKAIAEAVGADEVLDKEQQVQIMRYASDWNVFDYEMTITGAEDHQQIWKFLETVNCFAYSPL